jgi:hypothetical protein
LIKFAALVAPAQQAGKLPTIGLMGHLASV